MPVSGSSWEVSGRNNDCNHFQNPVTSQVTFRDVLRSPGRLLRDVISELVRDELELVRSGNPGRMKSISYAKAPGHFLKQEICLKSQKTHI